jgi:hypothetical protein
MRRTLWIVAASTLFGGASPVLAAAPDGVQIRRWLTQLDDEDFARREEATARLQAAGEASIDALAAGAVSSSPETAWRAGEALKRIALEGNEQTLDRVAAALDRVGQQGRGGMNKVVAEIRVRQRQMRHDRAATKIRQLGGGLAGSDVSFSDDGTFFLGGGLMMPVAMPIVEVEERMVEAVEVPVEEPAEAPAEVADEVARAEEPAREEDDKLPKPLAAGLDELVKELFPAKPAAKIAKPRVVVETRVIEAPAAAAKPVVEAKPEEAKPEEAKPAEDVPVAEPVPAVDIAIAVAAVDVIDEPIAVAIDGVAVETTSGRAESLSLDANWRGGDKGLETLRDLPEIVSLSIRGAELTDAALLHVAALPKLRSIQIQGTKFSAAALRKFHRARPSAYLFCQGEAMVGIHADTTGSCTLTSVYPGSGAADAGLQAGDKIVAIDDVEVRDFSELTIAVYTRSVGDKLKIDFERGGKRQTTQVELRARKVLEP